MTGRRLDHEKICVPAVRQRRHREGKPPAGYVLEEWRHKLRLRKALAERPLSGLSMPARSETRSTPYAT